MNAKIERVNNEIEKTKGKISEFQSKLRELERQKTELENAEIVEAVRGMDISLADLAAMLKKGGVTSGRPSGKDGLLAPKSATSKNEQEDDQ